MSVADSMSSVAGMLAASLNQGNPMNAVAEILAASLSNQGGSNGQHSSMAAAVAALEQDEDLSESDFDDAVDMFMKKSDTAVMYLAIKNPKARARFLRSSLNKHRAQ
jgi:hypothetical protein